MKLPTLEDVKTEQATRSLYEFVRQAWPVLEPSTEYVDGRHIRVICDALERCDPDSDEGTKRLVINIPPRAMKSLLAAVFWPAWLWGPCNRPHLRFLICSYALQLAIRDNLKRRRLMQSAWYRERWGERFQFTGDQNAKQRFENDRGGYCLVSSPDSAATGEGGDVVMVDDPHNVVEAPSEAARTATVLWWRESMSTRLNDPKRGVRLVIGQRLHTQDLCGDCIERGGYEHICLPGEFEPDHPYQSAADWRSESGELLWPERLTPEALAELKLDLGSYGYAGQVQQRPAPREGGIIKQAWIRWYDRLPVRFDRVLASWDMSFKETQTGSFVVGQVWGRTGADFYLIEQVRDRWGFSASQDEVRKLALRYPEARGVYVEEAANGPAIIESLRRTVSGLVGVRATGSKLARLEAVSPLFEAGNVYLPRDREWIEDYVHELTTFPNAANDDQCDATSQALTELSARRKAVLAVSRSGAERQV